MKYCSICTVSATEYTMQKLHKNIEYTMQKPYLYTKYIISITVRDSNICRFHNKTETNYSIISLFS